MSLIGRIWKGKGKLNMPGRGLVLWKHIPKLLEALGLSKDIKLLVDGAEVVRETDDGLYLKIEPGSEDEIGPFYVTASNIGGVYYFTVDPGLFNGVSPSGLSTPTLLGTGAKWIYLKVIYALTASAGGYTYSVSFTSAAVDAASATERTTPLGPSTGTFYILLAKFTDGVRDTQYVTNNISASFSGTSASKATMNILQS